MKKSDFVPVGQTVAAGRDSKRYVMLTLVEEQARRRADGRTQLSVRISLCTGQVPAGQLATDAVPEKPAEISTSKDGVRSCIAS